MVSGTVFLAIERDAQTREDNAGYSGEWGDRGANILRTQVEFYKMGVAGTFPPQWAEYQRIAEREADPEWAELQRLRKKFDV